MKLHIIMLLLNLYFRFTKSYSLDINSKNNQTNFTSYIAECLSVYSRFHKLYHIDFKSEDLFENTFLLLSNFNDYHCATVYNYENNFVKYVRPDAQNVLHVIFTNNPVYWNSCAKPYNISHRDIIIFISNDKTTTELFQKSSLIKLSKRTFVLELSNVNNDGKSIYEICYYCGNRSRSLYPITKKPSTQSLNIDNFRDLKKFQLNVVFISNYPFIYCTEKKAVLHNNKTMDICISIRGIESHMIRLISKKMNFVFKAYVLEGKNTSYLNMLKSLINNDMDIAIGAISITLSRRFLIQFSIQYNDENYNLLYRNTMTFVEIFKKFFEPFSDELMWTLFILVQFLIIALLILFQRLEIQSQKKKTFLDWFCILFQMQSEQSITPSPFRANTKYVSFLLILWCLACIVICSAYKAFTLSVFLRPAKTEPQNLGDLLQRGYKIVAGYRSTDIAMDLLSGTNNKLEMKNIQFGTSVCEMFSEVQKYRLAMLDEWSVLQFQVTKCNKYLDQLVEEQIRVARRPVRNAGQAWATQPGAPYLKALDHYLGLILSGGLYVKWTRDHTYSEINGTRPFRLSRESQKNMHVIKLPVYAFYPLFIIYFFGMLLSFITFLLEIIYSYIKTKEKIYKTPT